MMDPATLQLEPQLWFEHTSPPNNEQSDALNEQANPKTGSELEDTPKLPPILHPSKYKKQVSFDPDKPSQNLHLCTNISTEEKAQYNLMKYLQYGHMPFGILMQAAKACLLLSNIIAKEYPPCLSYLYGKSTGRSWHTKTLHGMIAPLATKPGGCISVDQMESSIPGFVAQNIAN